MIKIEKRTGIKHECDLEQEDNEFALAQRVSSGYCIDLKRFIWSAIMISSFNARSMRTYKSDHMIRCENVRKLQMNNFIIHPFSALASLWELWMILVYGLTFLLPILYCFGDVRYLRYMLSFFNLMDIVMTFNIGYQEHDTGQVVCERAMIAKHYLRSWLIPDLLTLPSYCLYQPKYAPVYVEYAQIFILLRLHRFIKYINNTIRYDRSYVPIGHVTGLFIPLVVIFLWTAQIHRVIEREDVILDRDMGTKDYYLYHALILVSLVFMTGFDHKHLAEPSVVDSITIVIGFCLQLIFIAFVYRIIHSNYHRLFAYIDILEQINSYAQIKNLPNPIRKRMHRFMQYKYEREKYQERTLFATLPKMLQRELAANLYSRLLEKSLIFREMPMEVILKLSWSVRSAIYMPSEVIVQAGAELHQMYFIHRGMVAVYTQSGKETYHLLEGNTFGELLMIENEVRSATVVAIGWCEVCMLSRTDLQAVFENYPELLKKLQLDVHKRAANLDQADAWSTKSNDSVSSMNSQSTTMLPI